MLTSARAALAPPPFDLFDHASPFRGPDDVRRFREGDRTVLDSVYRTYVVKVRSIVWGGLRASSWARGRSSLAFTAMDLVQEVFLRAFSPAARRAFDGLRAYGPYIAAVARNVMIDWTRRVAREIPTDGPDLELLADAQAQSWYEETVWDPRLGAVIERYFAELDPRLRAVLEVRYRRGLSQREGAEAMGLSRQSLRTLECRLQAGLRRAIESYQRGPCRNA
jgi:RNA polymerase sigma-70 factor (ECF subfamily)